VAGDKHVVMTSIFCVDVWTSSEGGSMLVDWEEMYG